ncbi:MAG: hypothetical protein WCI39_14010 [Gallionellaceae bacterium]
MNQAITVVDQHYKENDRKTTFCDARKELRNDSKYFIDILDKDIFFEEKLNQRLQTLLTDGLSESPQSTKENIKLSLLCLNGHIAKLEYRRTFFTIVIAALLVTIPAWATGETPIRELFILLTISFAFAFWLVMANIDKRILILKRTAEHLKFFNE